MTGSGADETAPAGGRRRAGDERADETVPAGGRRRAGDERVDEERLEAGMRAAFGGAAPEPRSVDDADACRSVVQVLGETLGVSAQVSLRDVEGDDHSPVHRPRAAQAPQELPAQIGRYRIAGEIARGGVGTVYKARDEDLGRDIALKVLIDDYRDSAEMTRRFIEEAQIGGQLQHPGIVPVHEMGLFAGKHAYFAMKLVKGRTLARILEDREDPARDRHRLLGIFEQVCQTVAYAHARGVIHRDLKPSNVMVGSFGEVQVMDWGLAKILASGGMADDRLKTKSGDQSTLIETVRTGDVSSRSLAGSVLGTPAYMAPEQARGEVADVDERSDVFGLGAILCEILTGDAPYTGENVEAIHRHARKGYLEDALARLDRVSADREVIDLAQHCLELEPRDRPRDAGEVASRVHAYLSSLEERARALEIRAAKTRLRFALVASVLVGLLLAGAGYTWLERDRRERREVVEASVRQGIVTAIEQRAVARAAGLEDLSAWEAALATIQQTGTLVREGLGAASERAGEVARLHDELAGEFRDKRLLAGISRLVQSTSYNADDSYGGGAFRQSDREYEEGFREYFGVDLEDLGPAAAGKRIRVTDIPTELALAFEEWALVRKEIGLPWRVLLEIAIAADGEPTRTALRNALLSDRPPELEELLDLVRRIGSDTHVNLLVVLLRGREDSSDLKTILRKVVDQNPDSYRARLALGALLVKGTSAQLDEGVRHLEAAKAIRPERWGPRFAAGDALRDAGRLESALDAFRQGATIAPSHGAFHRNVLHVLDAQRPAFTGSLTELIDDYRWILRTEKTANPLVREVLGIAIALDHSQRGELPEAIRALEDVPVLAGGTLVRRRLLEWFRAMVAPDLVSYASIDASIEPYETIGPRGAEWRYLEGKAEPTGELLEWIRPGYDDSGWKTGTSRGAPNHGTRSESGSYSTLYLRRSFEIPSLDRARKVELWLWASAGFVVYLNGKEVKRHGVRDQPIVIPHDARAIEGRKEAILRRIELPRHLITAGENLLGLQGVFMPSPDWPLTLLPSVHTELEPAAASARTRERLEELRTGARRTERVQQIKYFEGRLLQLAGDPANAAGKYRSLVEEDTAHSEPFVRLAECLLALDRGVERERALRDLLVRARHPSARLWNHWLAVSFVDLERTPMQVLDALPAGTIARTGGVSNLTYPFFTSSYAEDVRWILEELRDLPAVRIDCGRPLDPAPDDPDWKADRFFTAGSLHAGVVFDGSIAEADDLDPYRSNRWFSFGDRPGYRIPLPPARYRVTLHFAELTFGHEGSRVFDVQIEGRTVLERLDIVKEVGFATALRRSWEIDVEDGFLDIVLVHRVENPLISGIEIERLE